MTDTQTPAADELARIRAAAADQATAAREQAARLNGVSNNCRWWFNRAEVCHLVATGVADVVTVDDTEHDISVFHPDGAHKSAGTVRHGGHWIGWYTTSGDILPIR